MFAALALKAKALAAGVTDIEFKVLEATNEDKWGPHGNDMKEIANACLEPEKYQLIMAIIWQRLRESEENWRLCYKGLLLCDFLIRQGPMRCVNELQRHQSTFERMKDNFHYKDLEGRDQGLNVRNRAGEIASLLAEPRRITLERERAQRNAGKYTGVSAADMAGRSGGGGGRGGGGYSGSGYGGEGSDNSSHRDRSGSAAGYTVNAAESLGCSQPHGTPGKGGDSGHGRSSSVGAGSADHENPFEATRRRIEHLRMEGGLSESNSPKASSHGLAPPPLPEGPVRVVASSINMDATSNLFPETRKLGAGKKLSDIKVNPAMAALGGLGGMLREPPPRTHVSSSGSSACNLLGPAPGSHMGHANSLFSSSIPTGLDLLGESLAVTGGSILSVAHSASSFPAFPPPPRTATPTPGPLPPAPRGPSPLMPLPPPTNSSPPAHGHTASGTAICWDTFSATPSPLGAQTRSPMDDLLGGPMLNATPAPTAAYHAPAAMQASTLGWGVDPFAPQPPSNSGHGFTPAPAPPPVASTGWDTDLFSVVTTPAPAPVPSTAGGWGTDPFAPAPLSGAARPYAAVNSVVDPFAVMPPAGAAPPMAFPLHSSTAASWAPMQPMGGAQPRGVKPGRPVDPFANLMG